MQSSRNDLVSYNSFLREEHMKYFQCSFHAHNQSSPLCPGATEEIEQGTAPISVWSSTVQSYRISQCSECHAQVCSMRQHSIKIIWSHLHTRVNIILWFNGVLSTEQDTILLLILIYRNSLYIKNGYIMENAVFIDVDLEFNRAFNLNNALS